MLGFRKIQEAHISENNRRIFEKCGMTTIQLTLASGHTPASANLRAIYINAAGMGAEAEDWLIEQADKQATKNGESNLLSGPYSCLSFWESSLTYFYYYTESSPLPSRAALDSCRRSAV